MEPAASSTASETKFSLAISSRPSCWRRVSCSRAAATSGSAWARVNDMRSVIGKFYGKACWAIDLFSAFQRRGQETRDAACVHLSKGGLFRPTGERKMKTRKNSRQCAERLRASLARAGAMPVQAHDAGGLLRRWESTSPLLAKVAAGDPDCPSAGGRDATPRAKTVPVDPKQAVLWYKQGRRSGVISAASFIWRRSTAMAQERPSRGMSSRLRRHRKSGRRGRRRRAGHALGILYAFGQGVPRNDVEAYFWLDLAAAVKSPNQEQYAANRQNVGTRITADQLSDIQDREAQWRAAHPRPE